MMKVRTEKILNIMLLIVVFILCPIAFAEAVDNASLEDALIKTFAEDVVNASLEDAVNKTVAEDVVNASLEDAVNNTVAEDVVNASLEDAVNKTVAEDVDNASLEDAVNKTVAEDVDNASLKDAVQQPCETKCGCEEIYIYDADSDRCLINFKKAMKKVIVRYEFNNVEVLADDDMAKSIYKEGEKLFTGILISVILFIACASVCVVSACLYCCRINYTDRTLKKNVKTVAKKLNRDYNSKKMASKREPLPPMSESCSVVVEPAGVFVA